MGYKFFSSFLSCLLLSFYSHCWACWQVWWVAESSHYLAGRWASASPSELWQAAFTFGNKGVTKLGSVVREGALAPALSGESRTACTLFTELVGQGASECWVQFHLMQLSSVFHKWSWIILPNLILQFTKSPAWRKRCRCFGTNHFLICASQLRCRHIFGVPWIYLMSIWWVFIHLKFNVSGTVLGAESTNLIKVLSVQW